MPPLTQQELAHFERRMRERSDQLREEIRGTLERSSDETHVRIAERARDTEDDSFSNLIVDLNFAEIERDAEELRRIDAAMRRIREGTYGRCVDCGTAIPKARLEVEPTALRCVRCQELFEKTHASPATPTL